MRTKVVDEEYDLALWDVECRLVCDEALEALLLALLYGDDQAS